MVVARRSIIALLGSAIWSGCGEHADRPAQPATCSVTPPTACIDPRPTYEDVAPIIEKRCTTCHSGAIDGPWPLTSYEHVADWWDTIRDQLIHCEMPPADSDVRLTDDERQEILMWLRCGFPK